MGRIFTNKKFSDYLGENRAILEINTSFVTDVSPTPQPTTTPTPTPSVTPSNTPSVTPSTTPSNTPSTTPSNTPSTTPSNTPSVTPSITPSVTPSITPTITPTPSDPRTCRTYDIANNGFSSTTFDWTNCDGSLSSTTLSFGASLTICAKNGSVSQQTPNGTITDIGTCPLPSPTPTNTNTPTPSITPSSSPGPSYDTDAKAYLEAVVSAGGTVSPVMSAATDTMFKQLKSNNLYTKLIAFYPYMGGTASSHRINANLNGTYNLSFEGGWTHGISGSTPNGTNGYADTGYAIPAGTGMGSSCDLSFGIYLNNFNGASGSYDLDMGTRIPDPDNTHIHWIGGEWSVTSSSRWASGGLGGSYVGEPSVGFYTVNRIRPVSSATIEMYKNSSLNTTNIQAGADTVGSAGSKFYTGCVSDGNVAKFFSKKTQCFTFIASYMNQTETPIFMNIINNFQTSLGRNTY